MAVCSVAYTNINYIGSLRAFAIFVGAYGFQFISRTGVRIEFIDLEAVLGFEG